MYYRLIPCSKLNYSLLGSIIMLCRLSLRANWHASDQFSSNLNFKEKKRDSQDFEHQEGHQRLCPLVSLITLNSDRAWGGNGLFLWSLHISVFSLTLRDTILFDKKYIYICLNILRMYVLKILSSLLQSSFSPWNSFGNQ